MFDLSTVTNWTHEQLLSVMPQWLTTTVECILVALFLLLAYSVLAMIYIMYERWVCGWIQCRRGPIRVGPWGSLQIFADVFKILSKEIITLWHTDRFLFFLAPFLVVIASVMTFACLPWGKGFQIIDFNVGAFFIIAVSSVGVLGILLAGWSSNSKYTLIGAMRSGAQMISYELSVGLSMLTMVCLAGTMSITGIVEAQQDGWLLFRGHLPALIAFIIYIIAANAENNRGPFDLPEAESELVSGFSTEYSGMRYAMFFMAEYVGMFVMSALGAICFFGGWHGPFETPWFPAFWLVLKIYAFMFVFMWVRATMPRFRYDQLMDLGWKRLIPLALANIVLTAVCKAVF